MERDRRATCPLRNASFSRVFQPDQLGPDRHQFPGSGGKQNHSARHRRSAENPRAIALKGIRCGRLQEICAGRCNPYHLALSAFTQEEWTTQKGRKTSVEDTAILAAGAIHFASNTCSETRQPRANSLIAALTESVRRFQFMISSRRAASVQEMCRQCGEFKP